MSYPAKKLKELFSHKKEDSIPRNSTNKKSSSGKKNDGMEGSITSPSSESLTSPPSKNAGIENAI